MFDYIFIKKIAFYSWYGFSFENFSLRSFFLYFSDLINGQKRVAMIAEMIHTASLLHDDVIDEATERRNKPSVNHVFSQKEAILAGDFVLSRSSILLAQLGNTKAVELFSYIINDLVKGIMNFLLYVYISLVLNYLKLIIEEVIEKYIIIPYIINGTK